MKPLLSFYFLLATFYFLPEANCQNPARNPQLTNNNLSKYVNPFIGTGGHGHTFPGPTMPFGACQVSPDTRLEGWDGCSGYHYSDSVIYGFSHTHLSGTGCSDYGDILLMPVTREMLLDKYQYASHFSHANEKAHAGYYQVYLDDPKINVELTSTLHGAIHRYTFQKHDEQYLVLDLKHRDEVLDSKMEKVDDYTIRGYRFSKAWAKNQKVFFEIKFSSPIETIQYEEFKSGSNTTAVRLDKSQHCIIKLQGNTKDPNPANAGYLTVKCAISGVDEEGAHKNMIEEMPDNNWNFESYQQNAEQEWDKELSKIQIDATDKKSESQSISDRNSQISKFSNSQIIFYTALYHCMIHPSIYSDVDGRYRGRDDKIHSTEGKFDYYTVFSLWDTYRALHPLLTILDKKRTNDFIQTFIKQYEEGGRLPIWELSSNETNCMIGYHVVSVIWDAYNKGIRDFDAEKAYEAMTKIATHYSDYEGQGLDLKLKESAKSGAADAEALESYCKYGYVRSDDSHESVSKTLEYAYDDWCIAQMANALGKKKDYEYYLDRSHNWMNVYDPTTGFMRARKNGCLYEPFSPYTVDNNYTEANAWQYSFYVPHEIPALISLQGGAQGFEKSLNALFSAREKTEGREQSDITGLIGQYAHGNEPSHHIAYLYNATKNSTRSQKIMDNIMDNFYANEPDGLIGNEDCGQMSAWYVLSSLGFYYPTPGHSQTVSAIKPSFEGIVNMPDGRKIKISRDYIVQQVDGLPIRGTKYTNLTDFDYELPEPKEFYVTSKVSEGPMDTESNEPLKSSFVPNPFIQNGKRNFSDSLSINIGVVGKESIFCSINEGDYLLYTSPIILRDNAIIKFYAENKFGSSMVQTATFTKLLPGRKIILNNEFSKSYSAGGADALMDGIYGKLNWRAGDWQGYQGQDIEVIMALDQPKEIKSIAANFLEDQNSWIFYPKEVAFYVSEDSVNWTLVESIPTNKSDHAENVSISKFETTIRNIKKQTYKYIKFLAKNFGPMPQWHEGRGNPTYIFVDEFEVQ